MCTFEQSYPMKKIILASIFLLAGLFSIAQEDQTSNQDLERKNELTSNLLDLVVAGSFNVSYERLFPANQSLHIAVTAFDTYGYYDAGYLDESNAVTLRVAYNIYFSKSKDHYGFYFYPGIKLRTGKVTVEDYYYSSFDGQRQDNGYSYDIDGFSAGFGLGHKWLFADKFSLSINGEILRALGSVPEDDFGDLGVVEPRFGVNFGFRF
jgi:hypothetical protein